LTAVHIITSYQSAAKETLRLQSAFKHDYN